jgi:hypothetical protein
LLIYSNVHNRVSGSNLIVTVFCPLARRRGRREMYTISGSNLIVPAVLVSGEEKREEECTQYLVLT